MSLRPYIHALIYGPSGGGKSTMAATFPKPMIVLGFDRRGMFDPYTTLPNGTPRGIEMNEVEGAFGQGVVQVLSKKNPGKLLVQVEFFEEDVVERDEPTDSEEKLAGRTPFGGIMPRAYRQYLSRSPSLFREIKEGKWATVVVDSLSGMKDAAYTMHRFDLNKTSLDDRRWDKLTTDDLAQALCARLTTAKTNLVVLAHVDRRGEYVEPAAKDKPRSHKDKVDGVAVYQVYAPGRLGTADGLPATFKEMYAIIPKANTKGETIRTLRTRRDSLYNAKTSPKIQAPDGIELDGVNDYKMLWTNFDMLNGGS